MISIGPFYNEEYTYSSKSITDFEIVQLELSDNIKNIRLTSLRDLMCFS